MKISNILSAILVFFCIPFLFACKKTSCYSCLTITNEVHDNGTTANTRGDFPICDVTKEEAKAIEKNETFTRTYTEDGVVIKEDSKTTCTEIN